MTNFTPPSSGVLVGALVDGLQLRQTARLRSSQARAYFAGVRVKDVTLREVFEDLVQALIEADFVELPPDAPPREVMFAFFVRSAEAWDELAAGYRAGPAVPNSPIAPRAFARVAVVDLALRYAAVRRRCGLGPVPDDVRDERPGLLLRRFLDDAKLTREKLAERARVSTTTVDNWCDADVGMEPENILDVAAALAPKDEQRRRDVAQRLRRHYAFWRLRRAAAFLGDEFIRDAIEALDRIASTVMAGLARSSLPDGERRRREDLVVLLGRAFDLTSHLRLHASRTEPSRHWHAALVSDDERYVIAHAQQIASLPEVRAQLEREGLPVDDDLLAILADAPPMGLAPVPADIGEREAVVIQGDASFKANNREALSIAAELRGDIDDAIDHMRLAIEQEPTKPLWHFRLGALLGAAGGVDDAIAECRIAAAIDPAWDLPRIEVGVILLKARRPVDALRELLAARAALADATPHLLYHLGLAHFDVGEVPAAAGCFEAVLVAKPGDPWASNMLAEALFAFAEGQAGQERRATNVRALRLAKDAALKGCARALAMWRRGQVNP